MFVFSKKEKDCFVEIHKQCGNAALFQLPAHMDGY